VHPHGGPWARDSFGYDTYAQFLSNRGYAVLQPNFRGSTSYGKKFLNAGNGEWGRKMQDDLTWGVKALVAAGIADSGRVGISGGSYGGYATLARRGVYAECIRGRRRHRRTLQSAHIARRDSAVLGKPAQADVYAHGRPYDSAGRHCSSPSPR